MLRKQSRVIACLLVVSAVLIFLVKDNTVRLLIAGASGCIALAVTVWFENELARVSGIAIADYQVKAEALVKESTDKLEHIISSIPSPLVFINQRGEFDVMNRSFRDVLSMDAKNVYDGKIETEFRQMLLDAFLNEKQFIRQYNYHNADYQVLSIPMLNQDRYDGCMLIFQDVARLLEGEKMQKRFIADASHELKTPIAAIKGMSEILNRDEFEDEAAQKEFMAQIQIEAARLEQIVEDLLLQSRLSANKVHLEKTQFNLKQFFDGLIYERRQALHQSKIRVVLNCPSDLVIEADHFRLSQVFLNLFNNAINYAKEKEIFIDCTVNSKEFSIDFKDTGKGIAPEVLPHIFDRFYRGGEDRNRSDGGSGLGLAISKSIIEAHGGSIEVSSEAGKGTCFTIKLTQN